MLSAFWCCGVYSWLGITLMLLFSFLIAVILLNLLIAQLSDTYQKIQNNAQRELELNRVYVLTQIEKNSFIFKVSRPSAFFSVELSTFRLGECQ